MALHTGECAVNNRCQLCGHLITNEFVWCSRCEHDLGIAGLPMSAWPERIRALYRSCNQARMRERALHERERVFSDLGLAFSPDPVWTKQGNVQTFAYAGDSRGGRLVCALCGNVFSDIWPTWPLSPTHWELPACPRCGSGLLYGSRDN